MVERTKSGRNGKSKPDDNNGKSNLSPDVGGLTASLDALVKLADKAEGKNSEETTDLSSRKDIERDETTRSASAKNPAHKWDETSANEELVDSKKHKAKPKSRSQARTGSRTGAKTGAKPSKAVTERNSESQIDTDSLGIVELLGALKSDIDSLRKDNEEFKAQLMNSPSARVESARSGNGDSDDMRALLEALKDDIGNLREENELLRSRGFVLQETTSAKKTNDDEELYRMLADLKHDIVSLRSENDALRHGNIVAPPPQSSKNTDEVAMLLAELKDDINTLKYENESIRLENLTARDGAYFENLGGQHAAYRNVENSLVSGLAKTFVALVLVAGAAFGGYYLAKSQIDSGASLPAQQTALATANKPLDVRPVRVPPRPATVAVPSQPVAAPAIAKPPVIVKAPAVAPAPVIEKIAPVVEAPPTVSLSKDVETAMMARADDLLETRDLGAARMVFVYLARHGSASAMNRLAQTYDPQYLDQQQFERDKNADIVRAKRLYGAAVEMGDKQAFTRLQEMQ